MRVKKIDDHDLPPPAYAKYGDAGLDLRACLTTGGVECVSKTCCRFNEDVLVVPPGCRVIVPCGYAVELPEGTVGTVRSRSGWAKRGLMIQTTGTVDEGFRGEMRLLLHNVSEVDIYVEHGSRVAQMVVHEVRRVTVEVVDELSETARGASGWGASGA